MDKDRRVSIQTISALFDVSVGTVHIIIREVLNMRKICVKFVPSVLREDLKEIVVMTAGRWSSWWIQVQQFLILWWPPKKAGSTAITQRPRNKVPCGACWLSQTQEGQTEQIHQETFDDHFIDSTGMIYIHWVPTGQTVNMEYYVEVLREFR